MVFLIYLILFGIITYFLFFAGSRLIIYADALSEKTKISQIWIGMIALSIVTSLPEMVSNMSAVLILKQPNLALGNIIGSNIFN
ncbi:MAG TPA: sodium:calcium antiporter, partial [Firmicutes bacterium]|nr:sodium:calcium antiporter [Bacillota bacterium]